MTGEKGGVAKKLKDFSKTMINIHCICHRLALACANTDDDFKFIRDFSETLIELWKFFKNSSKRFKTYIKTALKCREGFDTLSSKRRKALVKRM